MVEKLRQKVLELQQSRGLGAPLKGFGVGRRYSHPEVDRIWGI